MPEALIYQQNLFHFCLLMHGQKIPPRSNCMLFPLNTVESGNLTIYIFTFFRKRMSLKFETISEYMNCIEECDGKQKKNTCLHNRVCEV